MVNLSSLGAGIAGGATVAIILKGVDSFSSEFKKAETSLNKLKTVGKIAGIALAGALTAFTVSAVRSAAESEAVSFRIRKSFGDMANEVQDVAKKMQSASIQSDEVIGQAFVDLQTKTKNLGLTFTQQSSLIQGSMDLAAKTGLDFNSVVDAVSMGLMGQTRGLKQLGIQLDSNATKTEILAAIQGKMADATGAAKEETDTFEGAMKLLKNQLDDVKEATAEKLIPALTDLAKTIGNNKQALTDLGVAWGGFVATLISGVGTTSTFVGELGDTIGDRLGYNLFKTKEGFKALFGKQTMADARKNISELEKAIAFTNATGKEFGEWLGETAQKLDSELRVTLLGAVDAYQQNAISLNDLILLEKSLTKTQEGLNLQKQADINITTEETKAVQNLTSAQLALNEAVYKSLRAGGKGGKESSAAAAAIAGFLGEDPNRKGFAKGGVYQEGKGVLSKTEITKSGKTAYRVDDFISRPGMPIQSFSEDDTLIGVKNPSKLMSGGGMTINIQIDNLVGNGADAGEMIAELLNERLKPLVSY